MPTLKEIKENPPSSYLVKLARVESGNNPNAKAKTSSASGLFQFTEGTWRDLNDKYKLGYTLADRFNPEKSKKVVKLLTAENENALKPILGRELNDGEKYLGHFLGAQGSKELLNTYLKNPNESIGNVVSVGALKANKSVFLNKDGSQKTVREVYDWAAKKMKLKPSDTNSATPYINQDYTEKVTPNINYFNIPKESPTFVATAEIADKKEEETTDKEVEKIEKESNFLREIENLQKEDYSYLQPAQKQVQQELPQTNFLQQYEQVSQFIDEPLIAQQGGKYSENELAFLSEMNKNIPVSSNGLYDYPNQKVIVPTINGKITMKNIDYSVLGIDEYGNSKIMQPDKEYQFRGKTITEIPLFKNK